MQPVIINDATDMARVLAARRLERGLTVEELDAHAGLQERYSGKLEHPERHWGRGSIQLTPMAAIWLDALGCKIVLVDNETAMAIGAVASPRKPRSIPATMPSRPVTLRLKAA